MNVYYGIIEDINDPMKIGRVRVRVIGKHTENRSDSSLNSYLPTSSLPWADCASGNNTRDFNPPMNGSLCLCAYVDQYEQKLKVLAIFPRVIDGLPDFTKGFSDPNSVNPASAEVGESQVSRLARNENITDTIIQDMKDDVETSVTTNTTSFSEPQTQYAAEYGQNRVIDTGKHIIEIDNTDGVERIHIHHYSGSFEEYHPNGDIVKKVKGDRYIICADDDNILVKGGKNVRIEDGYNVEVVGNCNIKASGTMNLEATTINLN